MPAKTLLTVFIISAILVTDLHGIRGYQLQDEQAKHESRPAQTINQQTFNQQHKPTSFGPVHQQYQHAAASLAPSQWRSHAIMPPNNDQIMAQLPHQTVSPVSADNWQHIKFAPTVQISNLSSVDRVQKSDGNQQIRQNEQQSAISNSFLSGNLEFALRQATGDESVFQPTSTIGAPGHDPDWYHGHANSGSSSSNEVNSNNDVHHLHKQLNASQSVPETATSAPSSTTTTTFAAPIIVEANENHQFMSADNAPPRSVSLNQHQTEYQTNSQQNQPIEFNNQVVYEGPATAPPAGDYYFSSSEKLPNHNVKTSNAWWAIGIGHQFERASNLTRDDYLDYCDKSQLLVSNKQRALCRLHPKVMNIVARGLRLAIDECQSRFASSRWNCSVVLEDSLALENQSRPPQVFGDVMQNPNRERSYLNSIIAAGLAHAMTKACSQNELPEECSCDKKIKSRSSRGKIEWVACSDDIEYGAKFSRDFTDNFDIESDSTSAIYLHNNEVGRRVFKSAIDITCTCNDGEKGLCQKKRCWRQLGPFAEIGDELMKRYEGATHVQRSNRDPHKLRPVRRGVRKPKRKDLVYIDESPDYCQSDSRIGVLGTHNRRCNSTSAGPDSCSLLCCGRGYQVVVEEVEEDCNCKFVWCCDVKCDKCKRHVTKDICN